MILKMRKSEIRALVCGTREKLKEDFVKSLTAEIIDSEKLGSNNNCDTKIKSDQIINLQNDIKFQLIPALTDPSDQPKTTDILFNLVDALKFFSEDFSSIIFLIDNSNPTLETHDIDEIRMVINMFGEEVVNHLIFLISSGSKPELSADEYFQLESELCKNVLKQLKIKKIFAKEHQIILNWNNQVDSVKKITSLTHLNDIFDRRKHSQQTLTDGSIPSKVKQAINILLTHYNIKLEEVKELHTLYEKLEQGVQERLGSLRKNFEIWSQIHCELGYLKGQIDLNKNLERAISDERHRKEHGAIVFKKFPDTPKDDLDKIKIKKPPKLRKKDKKEILMTNGGKEKEEEARVVED